jgi:hypothetical protein
MGTPEWGVLTHRKKLSEAFHVLWGPVMSQMSSSSASMSSKRRLEPISFPTSSTLVKNGTGHFSGESHHSPLSGLRRAGYTTPRQLNSFCRLFFSKSGTNTILQKKLGLLFIETVVNSDIRQGKGEVSPVLNELSTTPWRRIGEWMYRSTFSWPRHKLEASGQLHSPAALTPEKESPVPIG